LATLPCHDVPTVSVIMPVYNGAQWLAAAVESVLAQTLSNIEVLIVDDGSVDDTVLIAQQFASRDARVRLLRQAGNRGQAAARNLALGHARGAWIAPVDADDEIFPDRLRRLVEAGESEQADMIADGLLIRGPRGPGTPNELMPWGGAAGQRLERLSAETLIRSGLAGGRCSLGYLKPLMRRRFLVAHDLHYAEDLRFAEDFHLYARALFCGARFLLYPESHYVYWQTPSSVSRAGAPRNAGHALRGSERLRALLPPADSAAISEALDEYDQRWQFLFWIGQLKRGVAAGHWRKVVGLMIRLPANPIRIMRYVRERARVRAAAPMTEEAARYAARRVNREADSPSRVI
jgi:succinoglycan biosynthesis protein ExoO